MKNKLYDRIKGALYGVAIGDALGAPLEFMTKNSINAKHGLVTEMIGGGWLNVKPGEVTDDTQMTIAVAKGIIDNPENPVPSVGKHFIEWLKTNPKDVGNTCRSSIIKAMHFEKGKKEISKSTWMKASELTDKVMNGRTAGNGALMRTIYPALFYIPGEQQIKVTADIARMTHWDKESTNACVNYVKEIYLMVNGYDGEVGLKSTKKHEPTGYVIDSYVVASEAFNQTDNFEDALVNAVNRGGDADTIGAITGGMAGARYGYNSIPQRWIDTLDPKVKLQLDKLADIAFEERNGK